MKLRSLDSVIVATILAGILFVFFRPVQVGWAAVDTSLFTVGAVGTVSGEVFIDGNRNGFREPSEVGVSGAVVMVQQAGVGVVQEATTDNVGSYLLDGLSDGQYTVVVLPPQGYFLTTAGAYDVTVGAVQSPVAISTGLAPGVSVFIPLISN
jgi:hypothetical protein